MINQSLASYKTKNEPKHAFCVSDRLNCVVFCLDRDAFAYIIGTFRLTKGKVN